MEGLRELRGMVVFPAEETTWGYSWYSTDNANYAAHLAYTTLYAICLMKHTIETTQTAQTTRTKQPTPDYARLCKTTPCRPKATRTFLQLRGHHSSFMQKKQTLLTWAFLKIAPVESLAWAPKNPSLIPRRPEISLFVPSPKQRPFKCTQSQYWVLLSILLAY